MTVKPILFSGPMVRAILDGFKTQTRRIAKFVERDGHGFHIHSGGGGVVGVSEDHVPSLAADYAPIAVGDVLWVRESITRFDRGSCDQWVWYLAGRNTGVDVHGAVARGWSADGPWQGAHGPAGGAPYSVPSIHMPRWASRLTLVVSDVRVERLREISSADAIAEGIAPQANSQTIDTNTPDPRDEFRALWDSINGKRPGCAWDDNPWVAAYTFTAHRENMDAYLARARGIPCAQVAEGEF